MRVIVATKFVFVCAATFAIAGTSGCANTDPCSGQAGACIGLRVSGNATGLDQLAITVDAPKLETQKTAEGALTLPVKIPLLMPAGFAGLVHVTVDGLANGDEIAHATTAVTLAANAHVIINITLDRTIASHDLSGTSTDMSGASTDMSSTSTDMSSAPDMDCPPGMQDNGHTGACNPTCATADPSCAAHQVCDDSSGTATCVCAAGYAVMTGVCTWAGTIPADQTFDNVPANSWTLVGGVVSNPAFATAGLLDPGAITWDKPTLCTNNGYAKQTITMPPYAAADPFAMTVSAQETCSNSMFCGGVSALDIQINGGANFFTTTTGFTNGKVCLGDRAYGGTFDMILRRWDQSTCGASSMITAGLQVDHLSIDVDTSCPVPGTVYNGTFNAADGWVSTGSGGTAVINATDGTDGGPAARLSGTETCQVAAYTGHFSPSASGLQYLALQFDVKSNIASNQPMYLYGPVGGPNYGVVPPIYGTVTAVDTAYHTAKICVPQWAYGEAMPVEFYYQLPVGAGCTQAYGPAQWNLDNITLAPDGSCATSGISDPGFERTDLGEVWALNQNVSGSNAYAYIEQGSFDAHSGNASLKISLSQNCGYNSAVSTITVPPSSGANGPALKFWYKLPLATSSTFTVQPTGVTIPVSATYTQMTVCLDPTEVGQWQRVVFAGSSSGACATTYPVEVMNVDDLTVTTDPSCPTM